MVTTHGNIRVDIPRGAFSNDIALQASDLQAPASKKASVPSSRRCPGNWYQCSLATSAFEFINKTGVTQLRLHFSLDDDNDLTADFIKFYSGNAAAAYQPELIVTYYMHSAS